MKYLRIEDLEPLARGAAILGSGGGGDPAYELLMARYQMLLHGEAPLWDVSDLEDDSLVVPVAFMGAPLIGQEKLPSGKEFIAIFDAIEKKFGKRPTVIMPGEIGGSNALVPFCIGNMPVLDADTIGRAFPELQMSVCNLFGIPPTPAFLANSLGECIEISAQSASEMEGMARDIAISFGSSCAIACYIMTGKQAKETVVRGSISRAIHLGNTLGCEPCLAKGTIIDIAQEIKQGFLEGSVTLDCGVKIMYRNEYLVATQGDQILAVTPDIIVMMEQESGIPITSESLQYGLRVHVLSLPAPEIWKTKKGLQLVGPEVLCTQLV